MEYSLYLDDVRVPKSDRAWTIVRSYDEAIELMIKHGCPKYMSFDHDLGEGLSGYDVAKWMVIKDHANEGAFIPEEFEYNVHSANPVGAEYIRSHLEHYMSYKRTGIRR